MANHQRSNSSQRNLSPSRSHQDASNLNHNNLNSPQKFQRNQKNSFQSSHITTPLSPSNRNPSPVKRVLNNTHSPIKSSPRPTFSSHSRATSPTKASSFKQNSKTNLNPESSRPPLWNNPRSTNGLGLNLGHSNHGRTSPTRPSSSLKPTFSETDSINSSLVNLTFVSAASGIDENHPPPSPNKLKPHPSSMLAGLGFNRSGNQKKLSTNPILSPGKTKNIILNSDLSKNDQKKEPIKAYLRIRPPNTPSNIRQPYITILNDTQVLLVPPTQYSASNFTTQETTNSKYKFTRVYGPEVTQQEFFQGTGLPLVKDLLNGKSSLCFAYGVTASGKTYTVQGGLDTVRGGGSMDPGLLPRTMDVLFNSISDRLTELPIKPVRLNGIELTPVVPQLLKVLQRDSISNVSSPTRVESPLLLTDPTVLPVDQNSEYGVWISYAEVYNEKVYDLLDSILESSSSSSHTFQSFTANLAEQVKNAAQLLHTKASHSGGVIKRKPLTLKHDKVNGNKYIHGLTEIKVRTAEEAKILLRHGQINRTVFSTFANRTSSRSHGIFTIKLIKLPQDKPVGDSLISMATVSRLSIVDLAGSERTRNTQTTGQRLKEAGNINKSLMVLGQCMETLRKNQDLQDRQKKTTTIVPFRHSKLTELFQSFFTGGEGKTVMIVNVNPCDTGFDENSHVMKFSAIASEIVTTHEEKNRNLSNFFQTKLSPSLPTPVLNENSFILEDEDDDEAIGSGAEAEDVTDNNDAFVDHLLDQVSALRVKLVEAEIRAAMIEAEVREQVMQEYNEKMLNMEALFTQNMTNEAKEAEIKADRKIDIFNRATQRLDNSESSSATQVEESEGASDSKNSDTASGAKKSRSKRVNSVRNGKKQGNNHVADNQKEPDDDDPNIHFRGRQLRSQSRRS